MDLLVICQSRIDLFMINMTSNKCMLIDRSIIFNEPLIIRWMTEVYEIEL